jgi:hypothetical protein
MNRRHLLLILLIAIPLTGCIDPHLLSNLEVIKPEVVFHAPEVTSALAMTKNYGGYCAKAIIVILMLLCWYRATSGANWVHIMFEFFGGMLIAGWAVTAAGTPNGIAERIFDLSTELAEPFEAFSKLDMRSHAAGPPDDGNPFRGVMAGADGAGQLTALLSGLAVDIIKHAKSIAPPVVGNNPLVRQGVDELEEAFVDQLTDPKVAALVVINEAMVPIAHAVLYLTLTWLIAFHQIILPLIAWTVIMPGTRNIAVGWLKSYISICLWPFFFGIVGICHAATLSAIKMSVTSFSGLNMYKFIFGEAELFIMGLVVLGMYFAIPMISKRIVNGTGEAFKVGFAG